MRQVQKYYQEVYLNHGKEIASRFLKFMREWDGCPTVSTTFYSLDVLDMKLKEAIEF